MESSKTSEKNHGAGQKDCKPINHKLSYPIAELYRV